MKTFLSLVLLAAFLIMPYGAIAQTDTTIVTRTESAGTISEFSPDSIVILPAPNQTPLRYNYTNTTTYVDETGAPVSVETVRSGQPVTVYYTVDGDRMIAEKVIVRKTTTTTTTSE